jgi:hypothetical protein
LPHPVTFPPSKKSRAVAQLGSITLTWEAAPGHGSDHFVEGWYVLDSWGATENAKATFEFHEGEFRYMPIAGAGEVSADDMGGRYEYRAEPHGDLVTLHYNAASSENTSSAPRELHYRNAGGISVLVWDAARFDQKHELGKFIMIDPPGIPAGILRKHPDFATALPEVTRAAYLVSWWRYQGCRFWDELGRHPVLRQHVPRWVIDRFYTEPYNP